MPNESFGWEYAPTVTAADNSDMLKIGVNVPWSNPVTELESGFEMSP